ncbi:hypothetical protein HDU81_000590 [Chytriomyces hyalinus]|nr:hypothetical protein HDU81_000590 [Chytriomyces hyalinus]
MLGLELRESILRGTPNRSPPPNEESHPTFMTPIRDCVSYMLLDMEGLEEDRFPDLELNLTVLPLGQDEEELKAVKTDADAPTVSWGCFELKLAVECDGKQVMNKAGGIFGSALDESKGSWKRGKYPVNYN